MLRGVIDEIKRGFEISLVELFFFVVKLFTCFALIGLSYVAFGFITTIVIGFMWLLGANITTFLCNILFTISLFPALCVSMATLEPENQNPENYGSKEMRPSKDFVIAMYILIAIYIWCK